MSEIHLPSTSSHPSPPVLPTEQAPAHLGACVEMLLRHPSALAHHVRNGGAATLGFFLLGIGLFSLAFFGFVVGSFSGGIQYWAVPLKISLGMLISALICFPSLYIFTCLGGIQMRLSEMLALLMGTIALTGVLLLGFAPVAWVFSQSTESVPFFGFLNIIFFIIGLWFGLGFLKRNLIHGKEANLTVWMGIFILVCFQMSATLRPIVGTADTFFPTEKKFFLVHWGDSMTKSQNSDAEIRSKRSER
jgi:hypothetical protein